MENPIKMGDLGVPLFLETPKWTGFLATWFVSRISGAPDAHENHCVVQNILVLIHPPKNMYYMKK